MSTTAARRNLIRREVTLGPSGVRGAAGGTAGEWLMNLEPLAARRTQERATLGIWESVVAANAARRRWPGSLPRGLAFDDSPAARIAKLKLAVSFALVTDNAKVGVR